MIPDKHDAEEIMSDEAVEKGERSFEWMACTRSLMAILNGKTWRQKRATTPTV